MSVFPGDRVLRVSSEGRSPGDATPRIDVPSVFWNVLSSVADFCSGEPLLTPFVCFFPPAPYSGAAAGAQHRTSAQSHSTNNNNSNNNNDQTAALYSNLAAAAAAAAAVQQQTASSGGNNNHHLNRGQQRQQQQMGPPSGACNGMAAIAPNPFVQHQQHHHNMGMPLPSTSAAATAAAAAAAAANSGNSLKTNPSGGGASLADLTPAERARQNRDRNREHARSTRLRKKAYVNKLKELVEGLHAERTEEVRQRRVAIQHLAEMQKVRRNVVRQFLESHCNYETDRRKWSTMLEDNFWLQQPITPYRSFQSNEIEKVRCTYLYDGAVTKRNLRCLNPFSLHSSYCCYRVTTITGLPRVAGTRFGFVRRGKLVGHGRGDRFAYLEVDEDET